MRRTLKSTLFLIAAASLCGAAQAHTGHGTHSLMQGLTHPLGADHMLAMLAVGVWSVSALPTHKAWQGPATFMLALLLGAVLGAVGLTLPYLEHAIALSVTLFGAMLVLGPQAMPKRLGLTLIALAAALHGLAHGAETPASGFAAYAIGFVLTTGALHGAGLALGQRIRQQLAQRRTALLGGLGAWLGVAGLVLASQV